MNIKRLYMGSKHYPWVKGIDIFSKILNLNNLTIKLVLWDLGGQPHFKHVRSNFYQGAMGAMLVYDITRRSTFENLENWRKEMLKNTSEEPAIVVIGNKLDLSNLREVKTEDGRRYAKGINAPFFETSAKDGKNVEAAFETLVKMILEKR
ncbi:MAG: Rab family GTPase [Candidatus Jordarchaeales archaeon]